MLSCVIINPCVCARVCVCVCVCERVCTSCDVVRPTFISGTSAPAVDSESRQQGRHDEQVQLQEYQRATRPHDG